MVDHCANPNCCKPLLYLNEGRVYIFDLRETAISFSGTGKIMARREHFWLCGVCSETMALEQGRDSTVHLVYKQMSSRRKPLPARFDTMAS